MASAELQELRRLLGGCAIAVAGDGGDGAAARGVVDAARDGGVGDGGAAARDGGDVAAGCKTSAHLQPLLEEAETFIKFCMSHAASVGA